MAEQYATKEEVEQLRQELALLKQVIVGVANRGDLQLADLAHVVAAALATLPARIAEGVQAHKELKSVGNGAVN